MTKNEELIEDVLDNFNFYKVANVMSMIGWEVFNEDAELSVPSVRDLRKRARDLLNTAIQCATSEPVTISQAGFEARAEHYDGEALVLSLRFILEQYEEYVD